MPERVVCLVFYKKGKLLLEQRLDDDAFHKNWMFTGGKVEEQDDADDSPVHHASVREAEEETGLVPVKTEVFTSFFQKLRDSRSFEFIGVNVLEWTGSLKNLEVNRRNLAWVALGEAEKLIGEHEVDKRVLKDFIEHYP